MTVEKVRALVLSLGLLVAATPTVGVAAEPEPPACRGIDYRDRGEAERRLLEEAEAKAKSIRNGEGVLWRVEPKGGGEPSHILGTMHVTDPRVTTPSRGLRAAFDAARVVAFENRGRLDLSVGIQDRADTLGRMVFTDGRRLTDLLDEPQRVELRKAVARRGLPLWLVSGLKPMALIFGLLQYPPCEFKRMVAKKDTLDRGLYKRAVAVGKKTADLEDMNTQVSRLDSLSLDQQLLLLTNTVERDEASIDRTETGVRLYLGGRIGVMMSLTTAEASSATIPDSTLTEFIGSIVDRRNGDMFEHAVPLVDRGGALLAVGAAHLVGDTGLVARFQDAGYVVTRIE